MSRTSSGSTDDEEAPVAFAAQKPLLDEALHGLPTQPSLRSLPTDGVGLIEDALTGVLVAEQRAEPGVRCRMPGDPKALPHATGRAISWPSSFSMSG
jgi:hypothetical protein